MAVSSAVEILDSNPLFQLFGTDLLSFVLPRSALAFTYRGQDDGRETFLREFSGLIGNVLLMGWAGHATTRILGDSVNPYNPLGIPGRAWITAPTLDAFGDIYKEELKKAGQAANPKGLPPAAHAREQFIHRILGGLESSDRQFSIESRLCNLEQLDATTQGKMLNQMKESVPHPEQVNLEKCKALLTKMSPLKVKALNPTQKQAYAELRQEFHQQFLGAGWGKLSENAKQSLTEHFTKKAPGESGVKGTVPLDAIAQRRVKDLQLSFAKNQSLDKIIDEKLKEKNFKPNTRDADAVLTEVVDQHGFKSAKEFIKQRLALSLTDLRHDTKAFTNEADGKALRHGLTSTIDLHHQLENGQTLHLSGSRGTMLKELKHFLEQFVDRAEHTANAAHPQGTWGEIQKKIDDTLFSPGKDGLWNKLIPQAEDGLITAAIKSKGAYTWVPLGFSIVAAGALTFYNNYLTMKKHGGKVFFPGEGMPPMDGILRPSPLAATSKAAVAPGSTGVYRNFGNFPNYPQFRNSQGGIIA